jgi:LacI family transcriptional regulator
LQYEVSRGTVREALDLLMDEGLLTRIPGKGTFVASRGELAHPQLLGIVVPYLRDSLTTEMLRGAETVLHRGGYSLIFCHSDGDLELERAQFERLKREGVRGLILFPLAFDGEAAVVSQTFPEPFPLVLVDRRLPGVAADAVLADNQAGARHAVEHLIALGHTRIACIAPPDRPSSVQERIRGYEQALRGAGILPLAAVSLALRVGPPNPSDTVPTYTADELAPVDLLLSVQDAPTALFCINDFIAFGVMRHLNDKGIPLPMGMSIVGFDDINIAPYMPVPLTTVAQPKYEIGARAAQLLLERLAEPGLGAREIVLPTSLVARGSTAAPGRLGMARR